MLTPVKSAAPRRFIWMAAALGAVLSALAGWHFLRPPEEAAWKNATFTQLTNLPGQELHPSLSSDGKSFLFVSEAAGNLDIYLQRVGGKNAINLTRDSPADDTEPAFSPDGERIAFRSDRDGGGIFVMGATGESVRRLSDRGYDPAWSPDGRSIAYTTSGVMGRDSSMGQGELFVIPAETSAAAPGPKRIDTGRNRATQAGWSPRGKRIAFWSNRDIWTVPAAGGEAIQVTHDSATNLSPVWSPDGRHLYFLSERSGSRNLWRVPIREDSGRVLGPPEQIPTPSADTYHFSLARDGRSLAYVNLTETANIHRVDFDPIRERIAGQPIAVTRGTWRALIPDVSPDGQWVAFSTWRNPEDVYIIRADGSGLRQITDDEHRDRIPRWSPDGKSLAFYSNRGGSYQLWSVSPDGSALRQLTHFPAGTQVVQGVWSPDGLRLFISQRIVEIGKPWNEASLAGIAPLESPGKSRFSAFDWSPDGRRLAGNTTSTAGAREVAVYSLESRQYQEFAYPGLFPRWLSDGRRLIFGIYEGSAIHILDTLSGRGHEILSLAPGRVWGVARSPDDRRIFFGLLTAEADVWVMRRG